MAGEYPGMEVAPSYYPVSSARQAAVSALSVVQYGAMAAVCFADAVAELLRTRLGVQVDPAMVAGIKAKRVQWCLGLWWVGNVIRNSLQSTGAFEVFYDGHEVFSKLKIGRMPNGDDLRAGMRAIMSLSEAAGHTPAVAA